MSKRADVPGARRSVACFGEALWDVLPAGIFLGGAPLNVAYHLARQGVRARLITAIGCDFLGDEMLRRIRGWSMDDRWIARHRRLPTGTVLAALDPRGSATYQIRRRVAWDYIPGPTGRQRNLAPAALIYGTLALRGSANRELLDRLCLRWPRTWRVLDLNLRTPFDGDAPVAFALQRAHFLKLNEEELSRLTGASVGSRRTIEQAARHMAQSHNVTRLCVTAGDRGAGLLWDGDWHWESARAVAVRDTVGAGDAFLAALIAGVLVNGATPEAALTAACRMGEFVAARPGATPPYFIDARGKPRDRATRRS